MQGTLDRLPELAGDAEMPSKEELRRALGAATACFIRELDAVDPTLCTQLKPLLQEHDTTRRPEGASS